MHIDRFLDRGTRRLTSHAQDSVAPCKRLPSAVAFCRLWAAVRSRRSAPQGVKNAETRFSRGRKKRSAEEELSTEGIDEDRAPTARLIEPQRTRRARCRRQRGELPRLQEQMTALGQRPRRARPRMQPRHRARALQKKIDELKAMSARPSWPIPAPTAAGEIAEAHAQRLPNGLLTRGPSRSIRANWVAAGTSLPRRDRESDVAADGDGNADARLARIRAARARRLLFALGADGGRAAGAALAFRACASATAQAVEPNERRLRRVADRRPGRCRSRGPPDGHGPSRARALMIGIGITLTRLARRCGHRRRASGA